MNKFTEFNIPSNEKFQINIIEYLPKPKLESNLKAAF